ncbi:periplasmic-binding protein-like domain protein [Bordetella bronchiseptica GA96-01]|uniref:substrate-binding domain-containing protein n=1 Tax=Bordetella bronchiseptica TaxID=518 RepID=UPI000459BC6A|nr:substrate-binding domain-containing protein [Bordetella bronchiseptica]AZW33256.1 LacI family transcriptional regulator [Bordetella bronchiseptica]KCV40926.1 periplasmic-binding protein-like domain protein [Bordetella bronchiseptica 345]KDC39604.1 periplasmic-binding protein-like domain protein [Bordetella bronchiseptica GA96-01]
MSRKPPGRPSIIEIARKAGVSPATVSRAFNQPALLKPDTLAHIEAVAQRSGFRPNRVGRSLRAGRSRTIGLLLPTLTNPVFADCFEGAEQYARRAGYSVMMATTNYQPAIEADAVQALIDHQIDGLILTVGNPARNATLQALEQAQVPHVLAYNESGSHPFVSVDNRAAARDMVQRLADLGHRRIALVTGPLAASDRARRRLEGARAAARTLGLEPVAHLAMPTHTASNLSTLQQAMQAAHAPTALFCSNDLLATAVIAHLVELGLRVPRDISVCGFDGVAIGALMVPTLCTVAQPSRDIGAAACARLLAHMEQGVPIESARLPYRIFPGGTVAAAPRPEEEPSP